jgi:hypothetical protein
MGDPHARGSSAGDLGNDCTEGYLCSGTFDRTDAIRAGLLQLIRIQRICETRAARNHSESLLRQTLLSQAREYSLPVEPSDINIDEADNVLRVTVDYTVPVNLFAVSRPLKFRAMGSGLLPKDR